MDLKGWYIVITIELKLNLSVADIEGVIQTKMINVYLANVHWNADLFV